MSGTGRTYGRTSTGDGWMYVRDAPSSEKLSVPVSMLTHRGSTILQRVELQMHNPSAQSCSEFQTRTGQNAHCVDKQGHLQYSGHRLATLPADSEPTRSASGEDFWRYSREVAAL